jgi:hypothetical protein
MFHTQYFKQQKDTHFSFLLGREYSVIIPLILWYQRFILVNIRTTGYTIPNVRCPNEMFLASDIICTLTMFL